MAMNFLKQRAGQAVGGLLTTAALATLLLSVPTAQAQTADVRGLAPTASGQPAVCAAAGLNNVAVHITQLSPAVSVALQNKRSDCSVQFTIAIWNIMNRDSLNVPDVVSLRTMAEGGNTTGMLAIVTEIMTNGQQTLGETSTVTLDPSSQKTVTLPYRDPCDDHQVDVLIGGGVSGLAVDAGIVGAQKGCEPTLIVNKTVKNNDGGTAVVSDFTLYVDQTVVASGANNTFAPGKHIVSESKDPRYLGTFSGDCGPDGSVVLARGDHKVCNLLNDDQPGRIIIKKEAIGGDGTFGFLVQGPDVKLNPTLGTLNGHAESVPLLLPVGSYFVSELVTTGWRNTNSDCSSDLTSSVVPNVQIVTWQVDLHFGETITCTFVNTKR